MLIFAIGSLLAPLFVFYLSIVAPGLSIFFTSYLCLMGYEARLSPPGARIPHSGLAPRFLAIDILLSTEHFKRLSSLPIVPP